VHVFVTLATHFPPLEATEASNDLRSFESVPEKQMTAPLKQSPEALAARFFGGIRGRVR
jgi:hypothetical protein